MRIIDREYIQLESQKDETLQVTYSRLKDIHSKAYNWTAPDVDWGPRNISRRMRSYVRRWITEWDLLRLFPGADLKIEEENLEYTYSEDKDLEREPEDDSQSYPPGTE